jgi:hypothetical protein
LKSHELVFQLSWAQLEEGALGSPLSQQSAHPFANPV